VLHDFDVGEQVLTMCLGIPFRDSTLASESARVPVRAADHAADAQVRQTLWVH
jgi:hypothetical protein